jgi:hypothetical protein
MSLLPPADTSALATLVQAQGVLTLALLRLLLELLGPQGGQQQGGGLPGGGSAAGGGGSSGRAAGSSTSPGSSGSNQPLSADAAQWLTGDTQGLNPALANKLAEVGRRLGKKLNIVSGYRTRQEQEALYQKYLNGTGNLAAKPGTSRHETGNAADVQVDGQSLGSNPQARAIALQVGLTFPVPGEPWHVELA